MERKINSISKTTYQSPAVGMLNDAITGINNSQFFSQRLQNSNS